MENKTDKKYITPGAIWANKDTKNKVLIIQAFSSINTIYSLVGYKNSLIAYSNGQNISKQDLHKYLMTGRWYYVGNISRDIEYLFRKTPNYDDIS